MVISHDREFLKKTCGETLEVANGELQYFPGNIEEFFAYREEMLLHVERINKGIDIRQKELSSFIERFRAKASKASQARSKAKQLSKLEKIEIGHIQGNIKIRIPEETSPPGKALWMENLAIGYGKKSIASGISHIFSKGEHIAILGDNGEGKSTLMKTIAGEIPAVGGNFKWGQNLKIAYYAQHVFQSLNEKDTIFDHLKKTAGNHVSEQKIQDMAGNFLFQGNDIYKSISVLSGGERSRLLLAGLLLSESNVFLFDEPTNHLDFESVEALGMALKNYGGTIFFISHDRTFVNIIATSILEIREGKISLFRGSYEDYVYSLENRISGEEKSEIQSSTPASEKDKKIFHVKKEIQSDIRKTRMKSEKIEKVIQELEKKQKEKLTEISSNYSNTANEELLVITKEIEKHEKEWTALQEEVVSLEKKMAESTD
jgi:ATP-binding cassette subfamily F protein 3